MFKKGEEVFVIQKEGFEDFQGKRFICSSDEFKVITAQIIYLEGCKSPISVKNLIKRADLIRSLREDNPDERHFDCVSCRNSFVTDSNELMCVASSKHKIVQENYLCEDFC